MGDLIERGGFEDRDPGPWRPISSAPLDGGPVDLWIDAGDFDGFVLRDCYWRADAELPDWYLPATLFDGAPKPALVLTWHASFWMPPMHGARVAAPALGARIDFDIGMPASWPDRMLERAAALLEQDQDPDWAPVRAAVRREVELRPSRRMKVGALASPALIDAGSQ